jgi:hypothetical protein
MAPACNARRVNIGVKEMALVMLEQVAVVHRKLVTMCQTPLALKSMEGVIGVSGAFAQRTAAWVDLQAAARSHQPQQCISPINDADSDNGDNAVGLIDVLSRPLRII